MKQVLAVRVGAKKAVGHIVSKRWWPTVGLGELGWWAAMALRTALNGRPGEWRSRRI